MVVVFALPQRVPSSFPVRLVLHGHKDERLNVESFGFLKLQKYDEVLNMMDLGFTFAERLRLEGGFEGLPERPVDTTALPHG